MGMFIPLHIQSHPLWDDIAISFLSLFFLTTLAFAGKKYEDQVIERITCPTKKCEEGQTLDIEIPSMMEETAAEDVVKVELSEGSEHIVKMLNSGVDGMMVFEPGYLSINKDLLKVTSEHEFWVLNKNVESENEYMPPIDRWGFKKAASLKVGDVLFGKNELIEIESIEWNHTEVEVVNINVEPVDVYFVNNILVHNKGNANQH